MKGVVFTEFVDWAESVHGLEVVDEVLCAAATTLDGAYIATGSYDWREFAGLVQALADRIGEPMPQVLCAYGRHMFGVLVARHPGFAEACDGSLSMLERVESFIHPEVRKLWPDAELPHFHSERDGRRLVLGYSSARPFRDFARGLIEGCLAWFAEPGVVECVGGETACEFVVTLLEDAPCATTSRP
ncbi:MAG: heme NO-binding domain-containing protein [Planctomycetes bacterium]|nr:heme NO-binding domain-containing protein [Planctomycetota bacterium]